MGINVATLQERRQKIIDQLAEGSMAVILSGNPITRTGDQFHDFVVWRNFFYLTNIDRANFALVLIKSTVGVREWLFIDEVSEREEKWSGHRMKQPEASALSGIKEADIYGMADLNKQLGSVMMNEGIKHGYFDLERLSYNQLDTEQLVFAKAFQAQYPFLKLHNLYGTLANMRQVKSVEEVAHIRTAIEKTRVGIEAMMKASQPGLFEYEIEAHYDFHAKLGGVKEKAFHTIAAAGANATILHYDTNDSQTKAGDLILFDLGCAWHHYAADISRTFPVNGQFTPRQKAIYQSVLDVEKAVIEKVKPGVKMSELNQLARDLLTRKCRELGLIGDDDDDVLNYYYHSIGHSLGLDTHDVGGREYVLEPGMVITIEPGLYISEESIGVRIEDDILVTEDGHENLSIAIMKEIEEIEAFMAK
ncbi:MAG: aminopeptidase P N-terminal domain-containing protein [Defluviitaleaceae bacterium]|nr:aminopeptidase P N-terminal domain-containing protein [Defluviitaleaceae bacterium]